MGHCNPAHVVLLRRNMERVHDSRVFISTFMPCVWLQGSVRCFSFPVALRRKKHERSYPEANRLENRSARVQIFCGVPRQQKPSKRIVAMQIGYIGGAVVTRAAVGFRGMGID